MGSLLRRPAPLLACFCLVIGAGGARAQVDGPVALPRVVVEPAPASSPRRTITIPRPRVSDGSATRRRTGTRDRTVATRPARGAGSAAAPPATADAGAGKIVVTPDRRPEAIGRSASAVSVVTREEIQAYNPSSLVDALRTVPGLDITETGGPGGSTSVRLRGANPGQTLVLIDGIRVNDPAAASGDFEFTTLLPTAVERIEVLRGPQSALYGSDAIGGVVNVITRAGTGKPRFESTTEAGSYGTVSQSATASGTIGPWSFAFSGGGQKSAGFSRYGYRIGQLERIFGSHFEADGFKRLGGYGRIGYDAGEGVKIEVGVMSVGTVTQFDAASSTLPARTVAFGPRRIFPDTPAEQERIFTQVFARGTAEWGPLLNTLTLFANETERFTDEFSYSNASNVFRLSSNSRSRFTGERVGSEYQGDLRLETFGTLTFGGKVELERASTSTTTFVPTYNALVPGVKAEQLTRSAFVLYQLPIGERLILTAGGRHDEVESTVFDTWRTTAAYLIPETGTKLRGSAGTGGKAPTLFQLFDPRYGTPTLQPERSFGWDAGIDQSFLAGRLKLGAAVFGNRFTNLITFDTNLSRTNLGAGNPNLLGGYVQTARAETSGVEIEGTAVVVPEWLKLSSAYTYLHAKDLDTGLTLQRRPQHVGRVVVSVTPFAGFLIEPRVTFVSRRFSGNNETQPLPRYARLDVYTEYRLDAHWKVFGRLENVTDARYQEVLNYGTTGRAVYGGLNATW